MTRAPDTSLTTLLRSGVAAFAVCTLYSGLAQYWHDARGGPASLYAIVAVVGASLGLAALTPYRPTRLFRSPLLLWVYLYLLMSTAWGVWREVHTPNTDQMLIDRYRSMALVVAMALLFDDRRARSVGRYAVVAVATFTALVNVAEGLGLVRFVDALARTPGRAGGLLGNPNQAGFVIVFGLAAGIEGIPRPLRFPAVLVAACGVAATFSRSATLAFFVAVIVLLWRRALPPWPTVLAGIGLTALVARTSGSLEALLESGGALNPDTLARMSLTADDSGRAGLARKVWGMFVDSPWVGQGIGSERSGRMSHNMYLSLAAEHGILGLLAFPALVLAAVARNPGALPFGLVFLVAGMFGHGFLEQEPGLVCLALAAARPLDAERAATPDGGAEPCPATSGGRLA
jgi:O-antigen ligase